MYKVPAEYLRVLLSDTPRLLRMTAITRQGLPGHSHHPFLESPAGRQQRSKELWKMDMRPSLEPSVASRVAAGSTHQPVVPHAAEAPESTHRTVQWGGCVQGQTTRCPPRPGAVAACMFQVPWPRGKTGTWKDDTFCVTSSPGGDGLSSHSKATHLPFSPLSCASHLHPCCSNKALALKPF